MKMFVSVQCAAQRRLSHLHSIQRYKTFEEACSLLHSIQY